MSRSRLRGALAAILIVAFVGSTAAQVPTLEQATQLTTARLDAFTNGPSTVTTIEVRRATLEEVTAACLSDFDADGVAALRDACPLNPYCTTREDLEDPDGDGFPNWKDGAPADPSLHLTGDAARDGWPTTDHFSGPIALFESQEDIVQAALEDNRDSALFDPAGLISIAEQAGFDAELVAAWREEFLEPDDPKDCKECRKQCRQEFKKECRESRRGCKRLLCRLAARKECRRQCRENCRRRPVPHPVPQPSPRPHPHGHDDRDHGSHGRPKDRDDREEKGKGGKEDRGTDGGFLGSLGQGIRSLIKTVVEGGRR